MQECPWNALVWEPTKQKRAEQIARVPAMLWSSCNFVSFDPRPVQPAQLFLPMFLRARDPARAHAAEAAWRVLAAQCTRLRVAEELLLSLLVSAPERALDGSVLHRDIRRYGACAARLASAAAAGVPVQQAAWRLLRASHLPLAGSVAVLLCALVDAELLGAEGDGRRGPSATAQVDWLAMRPCVLQELLEHLCRTEGSPAAAVSRLLEMVLLARGPWQMSTLRLLLALESGLLRDPRLAQLWDTAVPGGGGGAGGKAAAEWLGKAREKTLAADGETVSPKPSKKNAGSAPRSRRSSRRPSAVTADQGSSSSKEPEHNIVEHIGVILIQCYMFYITLV